MPRTAVACWLDSVFSTDTCPLGRAFSAMTTELVQQLLAGAMITVSQQTVSTIGSQHTVSRTGSQHTGWYTGSQHTGSQHTGSQHTGSQHTGSQQAALRW
jgi:hypothetical protein